MARDSYGRSASSNANAGRGVAADWLELKGVTERDRRPSLVVLSGMGEGAVAVAAGLLAGLRLDHALTGLEESLFCDVCRRVPAEAVYLCTAAGETVSRSGSQWHHFSTL